MPWIRAHEPSRGLSSHTIWASPSWVAAFERGAEPTPGMTLATLFAAYFTSLTSTLPSLFRSMAPATARAAPLVKSPNWYSSVPVIDRPDW